MRRTMSKIIELTQGYFAIVDDQDYGELMKHEWYTIKAKRDKAEIRYAARKSPSGAGERSIIFMHRALMNPPGGMIVDHKDGDGLNCQRSNMRIVSYSQNGMNRRRDARNKSGASGVSLDKRTGKWKASICANGVKEFLGYFSDFQEAVAARQSAEKEFFGEYAHPTASTPSQTHIAINSIISEQLADRPRKLDRRSSSGVNGVSWNKRKQQWQASITVKGTGRLHLGWFTDLEAAIAARKAAEQNNQ